MREWRKVHRVLASSERLTRANYEARWLYVLLLVYQDDDGKFPWTPAMVRTLTATTDWTFTIATEHKDALIALGLGQMDGVMFCIRRGKELNGAPTGGSIRGVHRTYPMPDTDVQCTSDVRPADVLEERREEKKRVDESREEEREIAPQSPRARKVKKPVEEILVDEAFRERMRQKYSGVLSEIDDRIDEALSYKTAVNWPNKQLYVQGWLRRDVRQNGAKPNGTAIPARPQTTPDRGKTDAPGNVSPFAKYG